MVVDSLIRQPRQDRSQRTMDRILDAFELLIEKRPYEAITIADIARESKTGSSSIYARFQDKRAILLAVHERVWEQAVERFEGLCTPARWDGVEVDEAFRNIITSLMEWYKEHHDVMKAALLLNDDVIYERIADTLHAGSLQLSFFIQDRIEGLPRVRAVMLADFIFRLITAVFQQSAIFDGISPTKDNPPDDVIVEGLVVAVMAQFEKR